MSNKADILRLGGPSMAGGRFHGLAAMLLGLAAPAIVILIIDADALANPGFVFEVYFIILFVLASCAYVMSIFESGEITGVTIDRAERQLVIEKTGMLTRSDLVIPFSDVTTVRMESRYDDDGYQTTVPVVVLTTRELVPLPAGTTENDVLNIRAMLSAR